MLLAIIIHSPHPHPHPPLRRLSCRTRTFRISAFITHPLLFPNIYRNISNPIPMIAGRCRLILPIMQRQCRTASNKNKLYAEWIGIAGKLAMTIKLTSLCTKVINQRRLIRELISFYLNAAIGLFCRAQLCQLLPARFGSSLFLLYSFKLRFKNSFVCWFRLRIRWQQVVQFPRCILINYKYATEHFILFFSNSQFFSLIASSSLITVKIIPFVYCTIFKNLINNLIINISFFQNLTQGMTNNE